MLESTRSIMNAGIPLLSVHDLSVDYRVRGSKHHRVSAVDRISFDIFPGETLALVGESGCGKTTLGRALLGRVPTSSGSIDFDGTELTTATRRQWRELHREIQLIFQNPYASLNPRMVVRDIIGEPLLLHGIRGQALEDRVDQLLDMVRLPRSVRKRYPYAFSGGQRQRIVIARALALKPRFIVADEPVSALDVSIQAQIVQLMQELQRELGVSYLFIAHNLAVIRQIADRVAVMYLGRIVEIANRESLYASPQHPYTKALLSAAPIPDPTVLRPQRIILEGDPPSPVNPPAGCRFHTRCQFAVERCKIERPSLDYHAPAHQVACWVVAEQDSTDERFQKI